MIRLQIDTTAVAAAVEAADPEVKRTMFQYILSGGWTMLPIGLLFVAAIFIFIERLLRIQKSNRNPEFFMKRVRQYVLEGKIDAARDFCGQQNSPFSRMILKGLRRLGSPLRDIETAIENVGTLEIYRLEKGLSILATIAGAAPMLGFLGTVLGMIDGFDTIALAEGTADASMLAGSISTAMVTTASGLVVGILAYIGYNLLVNMVSSVIHRMETASTDFIDLLQEPAA